MTAGDTIKLNGGDKYIIDSVYNEGDDNNTIVYMATKLTYSGNRHATLRAVLVESDTTVMHRTSTYRA